MAGALLVIGKGFTRKAAGTKYGRYQGAACHFFRHVQKKGIARASFCLRRFHYGNKGNSKGFLDSSLSASGGVCGAQRSSPSLPRNAGSGNGQPGRKARPGRRELKTRDFFLSEGFQECHITCLPIAIRRFPGLCRVFFYFFNFQTVLRAVLRLCFYADTHQISFSY